MIYLQTYTQDTYDIEYRLSPSYTFICSEKIYPTHSTLITIILIRSRNDIHFNKIMSIYMWYT